MLDYAALSALAAVIHEGSFERAALALHVTPSAVSQRVRSLEERVGCSLVVRDKPCRPTEAGRRLCRHVDRVRQLEHELHGTLPALAPRGSSRVSVPVAVNADSLATWFAAALARYAAGAAVLVDLSVDDQDHTAQWLRSGSVLAAVTSAARPAAGCNSLPLGAMRYLAVASPAFVVRHFPGGVGAGSLARAPSLVFNNKDELQARWVQRLCHRHVELPRHTLPSPQAFVVAALAGMGWGLQPEALIAAHLRDGSLIELVPHSPLDVPLHWQFARAAAALVEGLSREVMSAARSALLAADADTPGRVSRPSRSRRMPRPSPPATPG
jgi:LysR family transcriptional regulator (chromosome initiation inhibitor)